MRKLSRLASSIVVISDSVFTGGDSPGAQADIETEKRTAINNEHRRRTTTTPINHRGTQR